MRTRRILLTALAAVALDAAQVGTYTRELHHFERPVHLCASSRRR